MTPLAADTLPRLIDAKRAAGLHADANLLLRLCQQALQQGDSDDPARTTTILQAYLAQRPDDAAVLALLAPPAQTPTSRNRLRRTHLWTALVGLLMAAAAGAYQMLQRPGGSDLHPHPARPQPASAAPAPAPVTVAPDIVIRAVGDIVVGSDYPDPHLPGEADWRKLDALAAVLHGDIVFGNLEGVLADGGSPRKNLLLANFYAFRMPTSTAARLRQMGFTAVSLANNHSADFGATGLRSTVEALDSNGIQAVGLKDAGASLTTVRGKQVAMLAFSYLPYHHHIGDLDKVRELVSSARSQADIVIVSFHGGREGPDASGLPGGVEYHHGEYRGDVVRFAHAAIDAGASVVLGHGPHVVRPLEIYRGQPVFYSLGNFIGYRTLSKAGILAHSMVAEVRLRPDGTLAGVGAIPLRQDSSGIPAPDFSPGNTEALGRLLDSQIRLL
ncbi:CapA family protein [Chitinimonas sp.]|uniref:CapA family protein n=1 Tax=Chitinimonas sp. TaxID=1934313 RepID=UPI0035B1B9B8